MSSKWLTRWMCFLIALDCASAASITEHGISNGWSLGRAYVVGLCVVGAVYAASMIDIEINSYRRRLALEVSLREGLRETYRR